MDQFFTSAIIGAIVVIACYATVRIIDIVDKYFDNRKYKIAGAGLTQGRLYGRPNNPPPSPVRVSANEELKRYIADEKLGHLGKVMNQFGMHMGKDIADTSPNSTSMQCDDINHPSHYTQGDIEVIDYIEDKKLGYRLGNVVKYVSRAGHKDDAIKDLKKARWYLNREIEKREEHDKSRATTN